MITSPSNGETGERDEILELLSAVRDGALDHDRWDRLDQLMLADPRNRQLYLEYMDLRASLIWDHSNELRVSDNEFGSQEAAPRRADLRQRSPLLGIFLSALPSGATSISLPLVLVAVVACSMGVALIAWNSTRDSQPATPVVKSQELGATMVAQLARTQEALWSQGSAALSPHAWLAAGQKLELSDGMAELSFAPRALVVMQGPASFTVGSDGGVLGTGKLIVSVPQASLGFSVSTPQVTIASSEAQFGVAVEPDGVAQVHVYQGNVSLALTDPRAADRELRLKAGEAMRIGGDGKAVKLASMHAGRRS